MDPIYRSGGRRGRPDVAHYGGRNNTPSRPQNGLQRPSRPPETQAVTPPLPAESAAKPAKRHWWHRAAIIIPVSLVCLLLVGGGVGWHWYQARQAPPHNPFSARIMSSAQFPLYYPTSLPTGYHIDYKSVTVPTQGVIVFTMLGPKGEKLYLSEESRPPKFDLGGFYARLSNLKEINVSDGAIAIGYLKGTEVASRANNKTWLLSNTNAKIPPDQLIHMLKSITLSY